MKDKRKAVLVDATAALGKREPQVKNFLHQIVL